MFTVLLLCALVLIPVCVCPVLSQLDIFATHGVGGAVGAVLTGLFADTRVTGFDGFSAGGGWINHRYIQLGYQLASTCAIISYTFVVTMIVLVALDYLPGLSLRVSEEGELVGIDEDQIGELGYDYAFVRRDVDYGHHNFSSTGAHSPHNGSIKEKSGVLPANSASTATASVEQV